MLQSRVSVNKVVFYLKLQQEIMIRIVLNFDRYKYIINPTFSNGAGSSLSLLYCSGFSVKRDRYFFYTRLISFVRVWSVSRDQVKKLC